LEVVHGVQTNGNVKKCGRTCLKKHRHTHTNRYQFLSLSVGTIQPHDMLLCSISMATAIGVPRILQ